MGAVVDVSNEELVSTYGMDPGEIARLEAKADAYDAGAWPEGRVTRIGRPPVMDEPTRVISLRLPVSLIDEADRRAKSQGTTRSQLMRAAIAAGVAG